MSTWQHTWGPPTVAIASEGARRIYTARQTCTTCGAVRNPISLGMVRWGRGTWCRDRAGVSVPDWTRALERVQGDLANLREDGHRVETYHTGRPG